MEPLPPQICLWDAASAPLEALPYEADPSGLVVECHVFARRSALDPRADTAMLERAYYAGNWRAAPSERMAHI